MSATAWSPTYRITEHRDRGVMKLLLTSSGITNASIAGALEDLLGKRISESNALFVPTAIYPFPGGGQMAWDALSGERAGWLVGLGWKSLGLLELTALPSIERVAWEPTVQGTDAVLVWGGDVLFLAHWMRESGLSELLPSMNAVYVGVSAGSMVTAPTFVETYVDPPRGVGEVISTTNVVFATRGGDAPRTLVTARGLGLVDFALIPHFENADHEDASLANAAKWARTIPAPTYAIDDQSAVKVDGDSVEVVSAGRWRLFNSPDM
jgi:dipeptidase E